MVGKILILFLVTLNAFANITVISDFDDTIKITNSAQFGERSYNSVFKNDLFFAQSFFWKSWRSTLSHLHLVSGTAKILAPAVQKTIQVNELQVDSVTLKPMFDGVDLYTYKFKVIKNLIDQTSDDIILIGDDVQQDPEVYAGLKAIYGERILATYIHVVSGREINVEVTKYFTTLDLALREFLAKRISQATIVKIFDDHLKASEEEMKLMFPSFAVCPKTPVHWAWQLKTSFWDEAFKLSSKINKYCLSGNSGI